MQQNIIYKKQSMNVVFEHNLFVSMITVLLVYGWSSLFAIGQSAFLNEFKACECIQLAFTTPPLVINTFPLGYERSIYAREGVETETPHRLILSGWRVSRPASFITLRKFHTN